MSRHLECRNEDHRCSVLLVEPNQEFLDWVRSFLASQNPAQELADVFFPEENGVWKMPAIGSFNDETEFYRIIDQLKPLILEIEVQRFTLDAKRFPYPISAATFDRYFRIGIRDTMSDIRTLGVLPK